MYECEEENKEKKYVTIARSINVTTIKQLTGAI